MGGALSRRLGGLVGTAPWTPTALGADIQAWWDPEVGVTFGVAPNVNGWTDKVNSRGLAASGANPISGTVSQNGHNVLDFESVANNRMIATYACTSSSFMVCGMMRMKNGGDAFGRFLSFGSSARANDFGFNDVFQFARVNLTTSIGSDRNGTIATATPGYATYYTYMIVFDNTNGYLYIDDNLAGSAARTGAFAITNLGLCCSYDSTPGTDRGQGRFGDIITMHRAPTTAERNKFFGWLAHRWDLTSRLDAAHPYKTVAPTV